MSAEERRRQLIEVAIDIFSRRGFSGTTTKEIANTAGVTEAIIFRHFATKEQLYNAILEHRYRATDSREWVAEISTLMDRNDDEGVFRKVVAAIIQMVREDAKFERVMLYAALEGHELAAMYHKQFAMPMGTLFCDYITRRQSEGALRQCHPKAVMFAMAGMANQYSMHKYMCGYDDGGLGEDQAVEAFTRILLDGVRANTTGKEPV